MHQRTIMPVAIQSEKQPLSNRQVAQAARLKLLSLSFSELNSIVCEFHEGVLTLRGKVNSFFLRQVAYSAVTQVPGVEEVCDRLEVAYPRK